MDTKKRIKFILGLLIIAAIAYFLGKELFNNWKQIKEYQWNFNFNFLLISFILYVIAVKFVVLIWQLILKRLGTRINFKQAWIIVNLAEVAKYMPGRIWFFLGKIYLCEKEGVSKKVALVSLALEGGVSILGAILVVLLSLPFWAKGNLGRELYFALWGVILLVLFILHPPIFVRLINWGLTLLRRSKEHIQIMITHKDLLLFVLSYFVIIWIVGLCYYFLINSFMEIGFYFYPILCGVFTLASIMGMVVIFVPKGLAVQEGVLAYFLSSFIPMPIAILIALAIRFWTTLIIIILGLTALVFKRR